MDVTVCFTSFLHILLSSANYSGASLFALSSAFSMKTSNESGERKKKGWPKIKLISMEWVTVCVEEFHVYLQITRMCWHVCRLTQAVTHSAWAFGTDKVSHPVQWFDITLLQDTCEVWVCFCVICSQHVISLGCFSFCSLPVFAPSTGTTPACSLTVLTALSLCSWSSKSAALWSIEMLHGIPLL